MLILAELKHQLLFRINKLFKRLNKTWVFPTPYGIKGFNFGFNKVVLNVIKDNAELDPAELHIGFDGLRDQYTMLGTPIPSSPHTDFMRRLSAGQDISSCDYIMRLQRGTLDERFGMPASKRRLQQFRRKFKDRLKMIGRSEIKPAIVYLVDGKYYIKDGKHRAALAHVLGQTLKCTVVTPSFLLEGGRLRQQQCMLKDPGNYSIALGFMRGVK